MAKYKRVVKMPALRTEDFSFAPLIRKALEHLVPDPERQGLERTPERVEKALRFLTSGYKTDVSKVVIDESVIDGSSKPLLIYENSEPPAKAVPDA